MLTECLFLPQLGMCQSDQNIGFAPERERERERERETIILLWYTSLAFAHTWYLCSNSMVLKFFNFRKSHNLTTESSAEVAR